MAYGESKWELHDLSKAMKNAILQNADPRFLRQNGGHLKFNGFWRSGDKQNVCAWLNRATWHDAKTDEGGGCKDFAKTVFNMTLPEFMERYGESYPMPSLVSAITLAPEKKTIKAVDKIWSELHEKSKKRLNQATDWLEKIRGFASPQVAIGSGYANLDVSDIDLFEPQDHRFIKHRLSLGAQIIAPLRGVHSNNVVNLFFRTMPDSIKDQKSRLLAGSGGWSEKDGSPRAFGFPHLIHDFPKLILCEGMADYFAVECLLGCAGDFLPIGAPNANALKNWALWLSATQYKGKVIILYQLDTDKSGIVSSHGIGQIKAVEALKLLLKNKISSSLFKWANFLRLINAYDNKPNDIADVCRIFGTKNLSEPFIKILQEAD